MTRIAYSIRWLFEGVIVPMAIVLGAVFLTAYIEERGDGNVVVTGVLLVISVISMAYSGLRTYRHFRGPRLREIDGSA